ncbi:hypothetical protein [Candidatus Symbiothrix dinenymphae]|uniref:hypothetical protein n=1 Tax=Candidatus Symbiothrix dinenymphae TaxID=467085 RepID=UPI0006C00C8D|nr:hypothetical protein [Candidatus Symbiothrix dinenymphae]GAP72432.1 hypothetical protein SAMD00024442_31_20 [Candidatus Symbiothrix dinenymphae]
MKQKVKVIVEKGSDNKFSTYMDCETFEHGFGLLGYGNTAQEAINDFYISYEEAKAIMPEKGKEVPDFEFDIQFEVCAFPDTTRRLQKNVRHFAQNRRQVQFA